MTPIRRIVFIGNALPRRCGIATFTTDIQRAIAAARPSIATAIVAMTDHGQTYAYPPIVHHEVLDNDLDDYIRVAERLNSENFDLACLQHEYGIFGGKAGLNIVTLMKRLNMPIVTTLHTVLSEPTDDQRTALIGVTELSAKVIVMAEKARELLRMVYKVPADKIEVIPHGIPDAPFVAAETAKGVFGFENRAVILTFGLLSPNKGIEVMIDAMPTILARRPDAVYIVLGATHPSLVREQGEAYRESLIARASALGVADSVIFRNQFVDLPTLLEFISMCDVYVTPYLVASQMTSGTLAYSFGLGRAIVSTPYWHACELLADGRGVLVPFGDAPTTAERISELLTDDVRRLAMGGRAYAFSRSMVWQIAAERYLSTFDAARRGYRPKQLFSPSRAAAVWDGHSPPHHQLTHLMSMFDDTGLFQHAVHSVLDRSHGYCLDDNARYLALACALNDPNEHPLPALTTSRVAGFIQHAWNPDRKRFRNFMDFSRRWLEEVGSEDSHGRTLWALGECARGDADAGRQRWATSLFSMAMVSSEAFRSPRAWAFALIGLDGYCAANPFDVAANNLRGELSARLRTCLEATEAPDWVWFEDGLAYDNARLPQALLLTGKATGNAACISAGLRSLRWLMTIQSGPGGMFRPVGSETFGEQRKLPRLFDQQPLEATATISACAAAWHVEAAPLWNTAAARAFSWFFGDNDLNLPLVDIETGSCCDGLHWGRLNQNCGGESVVSYLLALTEIRKLARISGDVPTLAAVRALRNLTITRSLNQI